MQQKKAKSPMAKYRLKIAVFIDSHKEKLETTLHNKNKKTKNNGDWLRNDR